MRRARLISAVLGCLLCATATALVAGTRHPGLWEFTTTMTWQKAPSVPGNTGQQLKGGTRTSQMCLTEEMIDEYGALLPQSRGQCSLENKQLVAGRLTADYVCTGMMTGKGSVESESPDPEHVNGKIHFTGTFRVGNELQPVEWTTESRAEFKSFDCGSVKPPALPKSRR